MPTEIEETFDANENLNLDILAGRFLVNDLPEIKPRIIRIFLCAPYDGTCQILI
jgi:hypothetical protein